ncbi:MAG: tetratricopeptide repeat protein [Bradyrhizobium sp.]|nr:tetratricopeptide repeat protein [Bradyrhizobium sp.]
MSRKRRVLSNLNRLVRNSIDRGEYDLAIGHSDTAIAYLESGGPSLDACQATFQTWIDRGEVLELNDHLQEALVAREKALAIAQCVRLPMGRVAIAMADLAHNLQILDQGAEARQRLAEAKALLEKVTARQNCQPGILRAQCILISREADLLTDEAKLEEAESFTALALVGWRRLYPEADFPNGHSELANALTNHAWIAGEQGNDSTMASRYTDALAAWEKLYVSSKFPNGHPDLASAYNNRAFAHAQLGEFVEAEFQYSRAVRMREKLYAPDRFPHGHSDMAVSYMNLGDLLLRRGDIVRAQQNFEKALKIRNHLYPKRQYPNGHSDLLRTLLAFSKLQVERGKFVEAVPSYERAVAMARRLYTDIESGSGHVILAWVMHDYGRALMLAGSSDPAMKALEEASALFKHSSTTNHLHASTLAGLAELYGQRGMPALSREYRQAAHRIYREAFPASDYDTGHFNLAAGLARLARVALLTCDSDEARAFVRGSLEIYSGIAERFYLDSAMIEGLLLRAELARLPAMMLSIDTTDEADLREMYQAHYASKGAVRRIQSLKARHLHIDGDSAARLRSDLAEVRADLARLLYAPFEHPYAALRRELFKELIEKKELIEHEVSRLVSMEILKCRKQAADLQEFCVSLPSDAVFLDVVRFARTSRMVRADGTATLSEMDEYSIFALSQNGILRRVDLGSAADIDTLIGRWRKDIEWQRDTGAAEQISAKVWSPIRAVLSATATRILVSPDGELNRLPWLALEDESGIPALEAYCFTLAAEPWLFSLLNDRGNEPPTLLAIGDIAYGAHPSSPERTRTTSWPELDFGKQEIKEILRGQDSGLLLAGHVPTAERVLAALSGKRVVHVVTHGFHVDSKSAKMFDLDHELVDPLSGAGEKDRRSARRHSLLLSGLVLAAANDWPSLDSRGLPTGDRSFLTAEEISGVDASAAQLVVLSACETNLGDVFHGEGVLGLRAAFHEAGAQCVVSSLWHVGDVETRDLMSSLYRELRSNKLGAPEALRQAQLLLLHKGGSASHARNIRIATRDWAGFMSSVASWRAFDCPSPFM